MITDLVYWVACAVICAMALEALNEMHARTSHVKRGVMLMAAVGGFGGIVRPLWPDALSDLTDAALVSGVAAHMLIVRYRPDLYADRRSTIKVGGTD